jgi:hypothetical protein
MRWVSHIAYMGVTINAYKISVGDPGKKKFLEDLDVDGVIIIKLISNNDFASTEPKFISLGTATCYTALRK